MFKARLARTVLGTLLAVGIWYGRPVMARVIETAGDVAAAIGAPTPVLPWPADDGGEEAGPVRPIVAEEDRDVATPERAADAVDWARTDAADRARVPADAVRLVAVERVEWRDSSLGCAKGGGMYMQVITPGYRIIVQAGETLMEYHSAEGQSRAKLCNPNVVGRRALLVAPAFAAQEPETPTR